MTKYMLCEVWRYTEMHVLSITTDFPTPEATFLSVGQEYTSSITRIADNENRSTATSLSVFTGKSEKLFVSKIK